MLNLTNVAIRRGGKRLLEQVSLTLHAGNRLGIVGRNGSGKSSLFALIQGELQPDAGSVAVPGNLTLAAVSQTTPSGEQPAIEFVLDGDAELRELETALAHAETGADAGRLAHLHERMHGIGGYAARARAARMLAGLGFTHDVQDNSLSSFSGGWRMRLNLARALMCRSDVLLLDEPTNHLDLDAVLWLQSFLADYPGCLLVISHDRDFLDSATTHTLHLHGGRAQLYTGSYSEFERLRAEQLALQQAQHEAQQKELAHMQAFVDRFRAKATKARQAQSRLKQMERMQKVAAVHRESPFRFEFLQPEREPTWLLRLDSAAVGYDAPLISQIKLVIAPGDRIALLGRNGAGKSTLMRMLAGTQPPLQGERMADRYLRVGYFAQHQIEQLDDSASALTHLQRMAPKASEQSLRDFLGGFAFHGDKATEAIAPFSGGEKARLALACVVYNRPNLLLLDEPTNHLDLDMRQALEQALQAFAGAVVLVAHDRHLIDATCDTLLRVHDGRLDVFDGDLDDYARWLRSTLSQPQSSTDTPATAAKTSARQKRQDAADRRAREKPLRNALKKVEREMDKLQSTLARLDEQLADPGLYEASRSAELTRLTTERGRAAKTLETLETEWLETGEALESLTQD